MGDGILGRGVGLSTGTGGVLTSGGGGGAL